MLVYCISSVWFYNPPHVDAATRSVVSATHRLRWFFCFLSPYRDAELAASTQHISVCQHDARVYCSV